MKLLIIPLFIIGFLQIGMAQDTNANKANAIYIEGLGIGMRYSINYERQFQIKESNFGFSLSGGVAPNVVEPQYLYFPFRLYAEYQLGKSQIGAGINYMFGFYWFHSFIHPEDVLRSTDGFFLPSAFYKFRLNSNFYLNGNLLFINNSKNYQYNYLASLPFLNLELYNKKILVWPGLSLGYKF
ncbi:MAG: hypothetical protein WAT43_08925 [Chitinophagales bacterium]